MFSRMLACACGMLRSLRDITERPDVADDTFLLAGRALSYAPRLLVTPQLLPVLLDSALAGLLVQHREACCSILSFIVRLLDPATHRNCAPDAVAALQAALAPRAPLLVRLLLAGAAGALPTSRLAELTDVLYALLKVGRQRVRGLGVGVGRASSEGFRLHASAGGELAMPPAECQLRRGSAYGRSAGCCSLPARRENCGFRQNLTFWQELLFSRRAGSEQRPALLP